MALTKEDVSRYAILNKDGLFLPITLTYPIAMIFNVLATIILIGLIVWSSMKLFTNRGGKELQRFHSLLLFSSCMFLLSYIPYFYYTTRIYYFEKNIYEYRDYEDTNPFILTLYSINQISSSIGLFSYVLMVQLRYRISRSLDYYSVYWDYVLVILASMVFGSYIVVSNMLYWNCYDDRKPELQKSPLCGALKRLSDPLFSVQLLYFSVVDSLLGLLLILKIGFRAGYNVLKRGDRKRLVRVRRKVLFFLTGWLLSIWFSYIFSCVGIYNLVPVYDHDSKYNVRFLMNDIGFFLTTVQVALSIKYFDVLSALTKLAAGMNSTIVQSSVNGKQSDEECGDKKKLIKAAEKNNSPPKKAYLPLTRKKNQEKQLYQQHDSDYKVTSLNYEIAPETLDQVTDSSNIDTTSVVEESFAHCNASSSPSSCDTF